MSGYRGVGKRKWCDLCGGFMGHEYRHPGCPPTCCDSCLATTERGCLGALAFLGLVLVLWLS